MRNRPLLLVPVLALAATAQESPHTKPTTGTVTGHIYCADTNAPARVAQVQLESVKAAEDRSTEHPQPYSGLPDGGVVQTTLDGSFIIANVPPGSYYVVATAPGYLSPRAHDADIDDAEPPPPAGQPPLTLPRVDVEADQTANVDIRLERGASVSGTIRFDDGSPAAGIRVSVLHRSKDKWVQSKSTNFAMSIGNLPLTNDIGQYRISGLRDREYLLAVALNHLEMSRRGKDASSIMATMYSSLTIYSGDTARKRDGVPFKLGPGEERAGEDVIIPLSKLHSVTGVVTAARDGHTINAGGVSAFTPGDNEPMADAAISEDGSFRFESVPEGNYLLRVVNPHDKTTQEIPFPSDIPGGTHTIATDKTLHNYGKTEQTINVKGDITGLVLAVPELKPDAAKPAAQ